ncbi:phosphatidylserine decarboxylase [Bacillus sp. 1P06AnD]|uniref:phosphatidylserine decarboxylase n=1 Tax=Bacillus sp. 1P06AnD TaxID=3132208 RepID=UPI0039A22986
MRKTMYRLLIELTNNKAISTLLMKFSRSKISRHIIPSYMKVYKLKMEEANGKKEDYKTLHDLFTRTLLPGMRPVGSDPASVVSPVDGILEDYGTIEADKNIIVKEKRYSIEEMLGNKKELEKYIGGSYMIIYLSPSHYHRIHSPISGNVTGRWSLGKNSYPVNRMGLKYGKAPLSKNYRVVTELANERGHIAVVKVGAMFVNSIEMTNRHDHLQKGEEFSYFSFGSTVVLLFEKGTFQLDRDAGMHREVKVGECLGHLIK